jgi:hypothetical protein
LSRKIFTQSQKNKSFLMQKVLAKNRFRGYTLGMENEMEFAMWNGTVVGVLEEDGDQVLISLKDGEEKWVSDMSVDFMER